MTSTTTAHPSYHSATDSAGWTHVIRGPRPRRPSPSTFVGSYPANTSKSARSANSSTTTSPSTSNIAKAYLSSLRTRFLASACYGSTIDHLRQILRQPSVRIERAICVALGSFTPGDSEHGIERRWEMSASQLVAFESWVDEIRRFATSCFYFPLACVWQFSRPGSLLLEYLEVPSDIVSLTSSRHST